MSRVIGPETIARVVDIARRAGAEILEVYAAGDTRVDEKADRSPLTEADLRSHRLIEASLKACTPDVPVLSEESAALPYETRSGWSRYWLVDPLDGTKEFLSRNGEFTVNIALIEAHEPVLGVVHVPAKGVTYWGVPGHGAWKSVESGVPLAIRVQSPAGSPVRVVGSRSHGSDLLDAYLARLGRHELVPVGSSLKFCIVAEGGADLYPRLGPTSEWDTAAAQAVVEGAGGAVVSLDGTRLRYNTKADLLNPHFFVYADRSRDWLGLLAAGA
jgi:3'(2'), 5'-bisphosphate nucleotidase